MAQLAIRALTRHAANGRFEPIPEVSNSRCVRSQKKFCCGAADLHAASQL